MFYPNDRVALKKLTIFDKNKKTGCSPFPAGARGTVVGAFLKSDYSQTWKCFWRVLWDDDGLIRCVGSSRIAMLKNSELQAELHEIKIVDGFKRGDLVVDDNVNGVVTEVFPGKYGIKIPAVEVCREDGITLKFATYLIKHRNV